MKAPLHPLGNTSQSVTEPVAHQRPEAVGQATAIDNNLMNHLLGAEREHQATFLAFPKKPEVSGDSLPYSGVERRQQNRRNSAQATTLDTRKGKDRRQSGRINLKI